MNRFSEEICFVCARPATGIGYAPKKTSDVKKIAWVCDDPECIQLAKDSYQMKQLEFERLDSLATIEAGAELEGFCDRIGKSDLRELTQAEFDLACKAMIGAYREALKGKLKDEAPF
jgi:hypothetical protein